MMSAATAPAKRTADGLTERGYAAIGRSLRVLLAGAPFSLLAAANRARQAADNAWRVLADPAAREMYDVERGFERPGEEF
jgi:hypothetical protein